MNAKFGVSISIEDVLKEKTIDGSERRDRLQDNEIIELISSKDERGLAELQSKFFKLIMKIGLGMLDSHEDAEDCANDTLLRVWNAIPPDKPENLTAYVCKIARRLVINRMRYNKAASRSCDLIGELDELGEIIPSGGRSVEQNAEDAELSSVIGEWLNTLDKRQHKLFMLRYFYLQSVKESARACSMSESSAGNMLLRLRKSLKKYLEERGYCFEK